MAKTSFQMIDVGAAGRISILRKQHGLSVKDLQTYFGFSDVRAIYKWQTGQSLPSIDHLDALSILLNTPIVQIIVGSVCHYSNTSQITATSFSVCE